MQPADTFHQFTLPETFFGWLNVTPRVGGRATYYSDVDGPQVHTNQQVRGVFDTGVDAFFKASQVFRDVEIPMLDAHELRHIIEPDFDYAYMPAPTRSPSRLPQFDYQIPSLRQLPIEFPSYNSIDSITRQDVLRPAIAQYPANPPQGWNRRPDQLGRLYRLEPSATDERLYRSLYRPGYSAPHWITFSSSLRYDLVDSRWREAIERIFIQPYRNGVVPWAIIT